MANYNFYSNSGIDFVDVWGEHFCFIGIEILVIKMIETVSKFSNAIPYIK